jgi:hypothetical protein
VVDKLEGRELCQLAVALANVSLADEAVWGEVLDAVLKTVHVRNSVLEAQVLLLPNVTQ